MYQEQKGLFGIRHTIDVTPIDQASPQQLDGWVKYWDEDRNAAAGMLATGLAITAGTAIGIATGEIKLHDNDTLKGLLIVADAGITLIEMGSVIALNAFSQYGRAVVDEARHRGLQITKGRFVRSISIPESSQQQ